jgi:ribosomal protein S12 methylthiotransferase
MTGGRRRALPAVEPATFHLVSLGCAKNAVDSASMSELLRRAGYRAVDDPDGAAVVVVNTCGFIGPAREESLAALRARAAGKRDGQVLVAAGCLTQRYGAEIVRRVPGIDGVLGTRRWMDIVDVVAALAGRARPAPLYHLPDVRDVGRDDAGTARASRSGASAYLKIADGCRRPCAFCAIPLIKGPSVSRPAAAIVADATSLVANGVRELVLIAQDTTDYGHDLGLRDGLAALLEQMVAAVPDVDWIRVMYAYPGCVSDRLIDVMASHRQILPYLDMPLQHAHPEVLRRMRRPANIDGVHRTLARMRAAMPELALRSTFLVGYPGETEAHFEALLEFVAAVGFDRIGAFEFSFEAGTASEALGDPVPAEVKRARWERLMSRQQGLSLARHQALVGRTLDVLVEGEGDGLAMGRTYRDAPEIDGLVIVEEPLLVGALVPVRITGALTYDLTGVPDRPAG